MGTQGEVAVSFDAMSAHMLTAPQHRRAAHPPPSAPQPEPQFWQPGPSVPSFPAGPGSGPGAGGSYGNGPGSGAGAGPGAGGLGFMSFNLDEAGAFAPPPRSGIGAGSFGGGAFEDEPPLLEELGINIPQIVRKMTSVLNPVHVNADLHEDGDLSGPLMFTLLLGTTQLLAGKVHFGILLGWGSVAALFIYLVVNLLVGGHPKWPLELYRSFSLVGYCLLPLVVLSSLLLFVPRSVASLVLGALAVLWATKTCSYLLVTLIPHAQEHRMLLAYPCALVYATFALLILF